MDAVSWEKCQEFCGRSGLSLPTEAQWEYACRAGTDGAYAGTGELDDMGWSRENSGHKIHPVGEKRPNDFGLYDMHGNLWELCEDWYQADFYQESTGARDPLCEHSGSERVVLRGGAWPYGSTYCRSVSRSGIGPSIRSNNWGFRAAWSSP